MADRRNCSPAERDGGPQPLRGRRLRLRARASAFAKVVWGARTGSPPPGARKTVYSRAVMVFRSNLARANMARKARLHLRGHLFATLGVVARVVALATLMILTGGFRAQFVREKCWGVNAHVLVRKYATDFRDTAR